MRIWNWKNAHGYLRIRSIVHRWLRCTIAKRDKKEVALKGQSCLKKLRGEEGLKVEQSLKSFVEEDLSDSAASNSDNDEVSNNESVTLPVATRTLT